MEALVVNKFKSDDSIPEEQQKLTYSKKSMELVPWRLKECPRQDVYATLDGIFESNLILKLLLLKSIRLVEYTKNC